MTEPLDSHSARQDSLDVAEAARETDWKHGSFAAGLFAGDFDASMIFPFPEQAEDDARRGKEYAAELERWLVDHLDADKADATGDIPPEVIDGLVELGAFALKIPEQYGGKGFTQTNYNRVVSRVATHCASTAVWLSAHQSIGVPGPVKMFGTDEQKKKYFPRLATGDLSAFALTEPGVGSDPAQMETHAEKSADGTHWILNGKKLWCTNGPVADLMIVMARTPSEFVNGKEKKRITAFIVERSFPGIHVDHRCRFMGIRAIQNGVLRFENVKVPAENVLWGEGKGLKLALITLNSGRLTLPACCSGVARLALSIARRWAGERAQWGAAIGKHEAVAHKIAHMAATSFAMDALTDYATSLVDRGGADVRIEAAMAKLFCSESLWRIVDDLVQIRGGRGFETGPSIAARGESGFPVERMLRDARINRIVEGTTEIMHLFLAREALDFHLRRAGDLFKPGVSFMEKVKIVGRCAAFYPVWYAKQLLPGGRPLPHASRALVPHLAFVRRAAKRLARKTFGKMLRFGPALERKEALLARVVEIGVDLTAMTAACARAESLLRNNRADASAVELADLFCRIARRRVRANFAALGDNDDVKMYRLAQDVLAGRYRWRESGFVEPLRPAGPAGTGGPTGTGARDARARGPETARAR